MSDTEYNGWTNYISWLIALHIDNDQSLYYAALECEDADELKEMVSSLVEVTDEEGGIPGLQNDILSAAISDADWYEIFDHYHVEDEANEEEEDIDGIE